MKSSGETRLGTRQSSIQLLVQLTFSATKVPSVTAASITTGSIVEARAALTVRMEGLATSFFPATGLKGRALDETTRAISLSSSLEAQNTRQLVPFSGRLSQIHSTLCHAPTGPALATVPSMAILTAVPTTAIEIETNPN